MGFKPDSTSRWNMAPSRSNGRASLCEFDWPQFEALEKTADVIPPLHVPGAQTIAQDRWDRLVTRIEIPAPRPDVWHALTHPNSLKHWLAACHGSLEESGKETVLDFEDGEFFLCRTTQIHPPGRLRYLWRWLGIGQATTVTWDLEELGKATRV